MRHHLGLDNLNPGKCTEDQIMRVGLGPFDFSDAMDMPRPVDPDASKRRALGHSTHQ